MTMKMNPFARERDLEEREQAIYDVKIATERRARYVKATLTGIR